MADSQKQDKPFGIPDLSTLFDKIGQLFEKERVVNLTEGSSSTLLIVPKSVDLKEVEEHWRDWCKKTFAEYLVEFKGAKVIKVENYRTKAPSPVYRSGAPDHGDTARG